jgi:hypothetical protein
LRGWHGFRELFLFNYQIKKELPARCSFFVFTTVHGCAAFALPNIQPTVVFQEAPIWQVAKKIPPEKQQWADWQVK